MCEKKQILHDSTYYDKTERLSILVASFFKILYYLCNCQTLLKILNGKKSAKRTSHSKKSWDTSRIPHKQFCRFWIEMLSKHSILNLVNTHKTSAQKTILFFPRRLPILIKKNKTDMKGRTNLKNEGWTEILRDVLLIEH